jgi:hypothetical protein
VAAWVRVRQPSFESVLRTSTTRRLRPAPGAIVSPGFQAKTPNRTCGGSAGVPVDLFEPKGEGHLGE